MAKPNILKYSKTLPNTYLTVKCSLNVKVRETKNQKPKAQTKTKSKRRTKPEIDTKKNLKGQRKKLRST